MAKNTEPKEVFMHDCPVLGKDTRLPRALMSDSSHTYVVYYQHKCPFCNETAGEREWATGVTPTGINGYTIDTEIAEKLR